MFNVLPLKYDGEAGTAHRQQVIAALKKEGFEVLRIKGSHHFLSHSDGRRTVLPVHRGEIIGQGLMLKILRDCEIGRDEFMKLVK